jgi:hypothetical protein
LDRPLIDDRVLVAVLSGQNSVGYCVHDFAPDCW